jgi:hypothetical protein
MKTSPKAAYSNKRLIAVKRGLSLVLVVALGTLASPVACADDKGLLLKQYSLLIGASDLLVCKQGIRLSLPSRRLVILMTPPAWNVQFFNLESKEYYQCPINKWISPMASAAAFFRPGDPSALRSVASAQTTYQDIACRKHTLKLPAGTNSTGDKSWERLLVKSGSLYVIDDKYYPKTVTTALARTFGTLPDAGIPLALTCESNRGEVIEELRLTSHSPVAIRVSDLQMPKGYRLVSTAQKVLGTEADNGGLADFIH